MAKAAKVTREELEAALAVVASADKELITGVRETLVTAKGALDTAVDSLKAIRDDAPTPSGPMSSGRQNLENWFNSMQSFRDQTNSMIGTLDATLTQYAQATPPATA